MKYVAFLRGINVGGRIVKMTELKDCLEQLGFTNVVTLLQSGNVVFESSETDVMKVREMLERGVGERFNYPAKILVYKQDYLDEVIKHYPFSLATEMQHDYVIFMDNGLEKDLVEETKALDQSIDCLAQGPGVVYWQVEKGQTLKTPFAKFLTKAKYKEFNTVRNMNTVKKLLEL